MQDAVDVYDLGQLGGAQCIQQLRDADGGRALVRDTTRAQRTGAHHALEALPFPIEPGLFLLRGYARRVLALCLVQPPHDAAQCRETSLEFRVGQRPHRGNRERGGAPALTPGQQQPRPVRPRCLALREHGQLSAVRGGLCSQF